MSTPYKTRSRSALARELIKEGKLSAHAIAKRTGLSVKTIYSTRWKMAQKQGLGAIKPQTPPVGAGTGIASSAPRAAIPLEFEIIDRPKKKSNNRRNAQLKRWARERAERQMQDQLNSFPRANLGRFYEVQAPTQPSLWQRIKGFFGV